MAQSLADDHSAGQLADNKNCKSFEDAVERFLLNSDDVISFNELQKFAAKARKQFPSLSPTKGGDAASLSELWQRVMAEKYGAEWKARLRSKKADEEMMKEAHERAQRAADTAIPKSPVEPEPAADTEEEDVDDEAQDPEVGDGEGSAYASAAGGCDEADQDHEIILRVGETPVSLEILESLRTPVRPSQS
jgi:hypothetical protein